MARAAHKKSYVGEYMISPAKHASDTEWVHASHSFQMKTWTDVNKWNQVNPIQKSQPFIFEGYTGTFASFFQTGHPNAHKLTNSSIPGVPENRRTGEEFVIRESGFGNLDVGGLDDRCGFWRQVARDVPI